MPEVKTLVFDTETTGFYSFSKPVHDPAQPGLCQLGAVLYRGKKIVAQLSTIMVPVRRTPEDEIAAIPIPSHATGVHGIDDAMVFDSGMRLVSVLRLFKDMMRAADRIVAFNANFDRAIIAAACDKTAAYRDPEILESFIPPAKLFCAERSSAPFVASRNGRPSLKSAYATLVDPAGFDGAHAAIKDAKATAAVVFALDERGASLVQPKPWSPY